MSGAKRQMVVATRITLYTPIMEAPNGVEPNDVVEGKETFTPGIEEGEKLLLAEDIIEQIKPVIRYAIATALTHLRTTEGAQAFVDEVVGATTEQEIFLDG